MNSPTTSILSMALGATLLELRGGTRRYTAGDQEVWALRNIDLDIRAGETVALVGVSGSGKSTLMNILGCLDRLSGGSYRIAGQDTSALNSDQLAELRRTHFGFVFQRYNLLPQLTALANVEVPAVYANIDTEERRLRAAALLKRLGLGDRLNHRPTQLSGGQQQRVSIARALINGGMVILADEPTGALDSVSGREVINILLELNRDGHTLILATHDPQVAAHAHRRIEIADGVVVSDRRTEGVAPLGQARLQEENIDAKIPAWPSAWVRFVDVAKMAWTAILTHRLRSGLTLLGIVIGIVSVTMMVAVGESAARIVQQQFGATLKLQELMVFPGHGLGDPFASRIKSLTIGDVEALRRQSYVEDVAPETVTTVLIRYKNHAANANVIGSSEGFFRLQGLSFDLGRGFTRNDVAKQAPVVVIDSKTRKQFFEGENPLNKVLFLGALPCVVVGVLQESGQFESPQPTHLRVAIPYTTSNARLRGQSYLDIIRVRVRESEIGEETEQKIIDLLTLRHKVDDVSVFDSAAELRSMEALRRTTSLLLATIGLISLVVGGIGVMNIMLVSVTERAQEIGIRIAVGARRSDIARQFLLEAVVLCLIGAGLGVLISFAFSLVASHFLPPGWDLRLTFGAIFAAVVCAGLTGVVFGYFPARNAARLDPVEALARE